MAEKEETRPGKPAPMERLWAENDDSRAGGEPSLVVDVAGFEGPLDLLLHLARNQKVDLARISNVALVDPYLAFIAQVRAMRLELAADYLVMAAWLAYLKSRLLIPKQPDEDGEIAEELAAVLQFRLKRLEAMRDAAARLVNRNRLGRDVFARVVWGTRISMQAGVFSILLAIAVGVPLGLVAGFYRGAVDQTIMRLTDAWLALPALVFAIFLATVVGPSMWNIVVILGLVYWTRYARVIRGEVLSLREREFVQLAEIAGASSLRVIVRHILPNLLSTPMVLASLTIGVVIIAEASLSFLAANGATWRAQLWSRRMTWRWPWTRGG